MPLGEENIRIPIPSGRLSATLHWPADTAPPYPAVIGVHGLLSNRQSQKQIDLARRCVTAGMVYLRFDHRGCGESSGDLERDTTLANRLADLRAVRDDLIRRDGVDKTRVGLFGSSFGGTVCLAFAAEQAVSAVVTLAAPIRSRPLLAISTQELPTPIPAAFRDGSRKFDLAPHLSGVRHLLCCHGDHDEIVPVAHAHEITGLAGDPKDLIIFENADHRISDTKQRKLLVERTQTWFRRHLRPSSRQT